MACWKDIAALIAIHLMCVSLAISGLTGENEHSSEEYLAPTHDVEVAREENYLVRENEMRLKSVRSLESLLLELYRIRGEEVCSAPITRAVKLGTWRDEKPDEDAMRASRELRSACLNAPKNSEEVAIHRGRHGIPQPFEEDFASGEVPEASSREASSREVMTDQLSAPDSLPTGIPPKRGRIMESAETISSKPESEQSKTPLKMSRISPPTTKKPASKASAPPDDKTLKSMNEILKDRSAECKPRKIPVEIPKEPNMTLLPACALVERCGGCCKHESLQCVPVPESITLIKKKVVATEVWGSLPKVIQVTLEKHNKCTCQCKVQASHCNSHQLYDKKNCRCACKKNSLKPGDCKKPQYWDEGSCKCRCPQNILTECSSGFFFSSDHCRCVSANEIIREENARRLNRS